MSASLIPEGKTVVTINLQSEGEEDFTYDFLVDAWHRQPIKRVLEAMAKYAKTVKHLIERDNWSWYEFMEKLPDYILESFGVQRIEPIRYMNTENVDEGTPILERLGVE